MSLPRLTSHRLALLALLSMCILSEGRASAELVLGGDVSALPVLESHGATYSDGGVTGDAIDILQSYGSNSFRLRLFVNPDGSDPIADQDLAYTIALAQRVKANGASLLLDLHYSDTWADPGKQYKPSTWSNLNFNQLKQRVYDYTKSVVEQFDAAGALPDMIQIGNEIDNGTLWSDGQLWRWDLSESAEFDNLASLLSSGISGARDGAPAGGEPAVLIHHSKGADWDTTSYYFDRLLPRLQANGTDIDAIGYSYYPAWHYNGPGDGDIADLQQNLSNTATAYGKPVYVVETGFAYTGAQWEPSYEFAVSENGQKHFLQAVVDAVKAVPGDQGKGVYWWYPEATPTWGLNIWNGGRYGLFDQSGDALLALEVFADANPPVVPGDFDGNGVVNGDDLAQWKGDFGVNADSDADGDGDTDIADLLIWHRNFDGLPSPLEGIAAVPEPGALVLCLSVFCLIQPRAWRA